MPGRGRSRSSSRERVDYYRFPVAITQFGSAPLEAAGASTTTHSFPSMMSSLRRAVPRGNADDEIYAAPANPAPAGRARNSTQNAPCGWGARPGGTLVTVPHLILRWRRRPPLPPSPPFAPTACACRPRGALVQALFDADRPLSAEELDGDGDVASAYRNLEVLEGLGLVTHVHLGHGPGREPAGRPREFVVCERCRPTCRCSRPTPSARCAWPCSTRSATARASRTSRSPGCVRAASRRTTDDGGGEAPGRPSAGSERRGDGSASVVLRDAARTHPGEREVREARAVAERVEHGQAHRADGVG